MATIYTGADYEAHLAFIAKRDEIISDCMEQDAGFETVGTVWHGCDFPAGTRLVYSGELNIHFQNHLTGFGGRDSHGCASMWFVREGHSDLLNLWACQVQALDY